MPEPKRPLKVFLCHTSTDKPKVRELYRYLKKRGIQPWFDEEDLVGGQDWQVEIPKALATSDAIIICLTKNSVDKEGYIQKEIKFALDKALEMPEGRIFLIPVKFEECEVPFTLSRYQWVDLTIESGYTKMMKALKFRASQLERSTVEVSKKDVEEENLAREKAEKEAAEKARLEAEEIERQKAAKEKAERETIERAERERIEKELREKRAREAKEKEKREIEKKAEKPTTIKPKAGSQIVYWFGGFILLVLGIIFLSSLNNPPSTPQPTPENTQTQTVATLTQGIVEPSGTAPFSNTITPDTLTSGTSQVLIDCLYTIQSSDTLFSIADKFGNGDNWKYIQCDHNTSNDCDMTHPDRMQPGYKVVVPNVDEEVCNLYGEPLTGSTITSLPTEITDAKGVPMALVPEGEFTMGSETGDDDEKPVHQVYLDTFYLDIYEVTNASYKACVDSSVCTPPKETESYDDDNGFWYVYYGNTEFDDYPVIYVDWNQAKTYCEWRDSSLPTEAQWEKAARGTDGRTYPWGEEINSNRANYSVNVGDPVKVGSYESGKSLYGIYDMTGNVSEWVADWYDANYYKSSPSSNPLGPSSGRQHVLRGGSWLNNNINVRSASRNYYSPDFTFYDIGFRCAKDVTP